MKKILVCGLINIETTLNIEKFPVEYSPVRYLFNKTFTSVSGVGFNIAKSLNTLGSKIEFVSVLGKDIAGALVRKNIEQTGIPTHYILGSDHTQTPQSTILYDLKGKRQINVDLKDIQKIRISNELMDEAAINCNIAVLCNINFTRDHLKRLSKKMLIATDVHTIDNIHDEYNRDYMEYSDILFFSHEKIRLKETTFIKELNYIFPKKIIICGIGKDGALMYSAKSKKTYHFPAVKIFDVVNTIGAGDALFSSFLHFYNKGITEEEALKKAVFFAGRKIEKQGAAEGFLSEDALEILIDSYPSYRYKEI